MLLTGFPDSRVSKIDLSNRPFSTTLYQNQEEYESKVDDTESDRLYTSSSIRSFSSIESMPDIDDLSYPPPPDGGWGWVIVFATFFILFISDGISASFGVFLDELLESSPDSTVSEISWIGSVNWGIPYLFGPFTTVLINKLGLRLVCSLGCIISALGCILAFFASSSLQLIFAFGFLSGIGQSFMLMSSLIIVSVYFENLRATATGLSMSGTGLGVLVIVPFVQYINKIYSWRGTMLIFAAFYIQALVFSVLLRPVETDHERRFRYKLILLEYLAKNLGLDKILHSEKYFNQSINQKFHYLEDEIFSKGKISNDRQKSICEFIKQEKRTAYSDTGLNNIKSSEGTMSKFSSLPNTMCLYSRRNYRDKSIFTRIYNNIKLNKKKLFKEEIDLKNSLNNISTSSTTVSSVDSIYGLLEEYLDLSAFRRMDFNLYLLSNMIVIFFSNCTYLYLGLYSLSVGNSKFNSSLLYSILGGFNVVAEAAIGWLADREGVDRLALNASLTIAFGISMVIVPRLESFLNLAVFSASFGVFSSVTDTLCTVIIVDIVGLEDFGNAFGITMFFAGIAHIFSGPLLGLIVDIYKTPAVFFISGSLCIIGGVILIPIQLKKIYNGKIKKKFRLNPTV